MASAADRDFNPDEIRARLERLARRDCDRRLFGSSSHNYSLHPPLDAAEVEAFERRHGLELPEEYRRFITTVGNGGAGPGHGLFPFGYDDEGKWGEFLPIGDPGKPFPYQEKWNLDEEFWKDEPRCPDDMSFEEHDRLMAEWDARLEPVYWAPSIMNGAIPICHQGCALRQWLVVNGEQRGNVWDDLRADNAGLRPVVGVADKPATFSDWYFTWLEEAERAELRPVVDQSRYAISPPGLRARNWLTLLFLIVVGVVATALLAWF